MKNAKQSGKNIDTDPFIDQYKWNGISVSAGKNILNLKKKKTF